MNLQGTKELALYIDHIKEDTENLIFSFYYLGKVPGAIKVAETLSSDLLTVLITSTVRRCALFQE